ncbi:MAG: site-specific DNA-methyltransferase [Candidatus Marinimicrobia bacterium]|nr:site-specific DNA-methyltransferase [Candidatus Neomarinimicrobiota bacterium]
MKGKESQNLLFSDPLNESQGLTISEINRYLPAVRTVDDIFSDGEKLEDGLYLADARDGLSRVPDRSIDIVIAFPPIDPVKEGIGTGEQFTLGEFYNWNEDWLAESHRVLRVTGSIYLLCNWKNSGMYHNLLSQYFHIQSRITWRNHYENSESQHRGWKNVHSDIWFATKSEEFLFEGDIIPSSNENYIPNKMNNFWGDVLDDSGSNPLNNNIPEKVINRILDASSFKLSWVLDPFTRYGLTGAVSKKMGRRFIGFETNQDQLLMAMKRIDQT